MDVELDTIAELLTHQASLAAVLLAAAAWALFDALWRRACCRRGLKTRAKIALGKVDT